MNDFAKYNAKDLRALEPAEPLHSQVSPNAHTADLLTRARYRAEGAKTERERIIKLLEDNNKCTGGLSFGNCTCTALALIKGEQK